MPAILRFSPKILAAVLAGAALVLPVASRAQEYPPYAVAPAQDQQIRGRIESIDGTFNLTVRDDNGYLDNIQLHQGTIINPTGLTLAPGMTVTVIGYGAGQVFNANEIDTPYTYSGPAPTPVYYGPGWWYPGFSYGYGPSFSLGIVVGFGGGGYNCYRTPWAGHWWGGSPSWYHGGGYGYGNGNGYHGGGSGNGYHGGNGGGYGGQSGGYGGSGTSHEHVTPTEPHVYPGGNGGGTFPRPVPVAAPSQAYHAPSNGGETYHAPSNGYHAGSYGGTAQAPYGGYARPVPAGPSGYRAPSGGGGYQAPSGGGGYQASSGGYRAPSGSAGGGSYHTASGGGGGSHGGGGGSSPHR